MTRRAQDSPSALEPRHGPKPKATLVSSASDFDKPANTVAQRNPLGHTSNDAVSRLVLDHGRYADWGQFCANSNPFGAHATMWRVGGRRHQLSLAPAELQKPRSLAKVINWWCRSLSIMVLTRAETLLSTTVVKRRLVGHSLRLLW